MITYVVQFEARNRGYDGQPVWSDRLKTVEMEWAHDYARTASNPNGGGIRIISRAGDSRGETVLWERVRA